MRRLVLVGLGVVLLGACNQPFDPDDRRAAARDEYDLADQTCRVEGDRAVATGRVISYADRAEGFGVVVRFFDGGRDLGRPQNVNHPTLVAPGESWTYEASVDASDLEGALRCDVIQVVLGQDVDR